MLGVFVARDIILFYVFFEFTLVPLFFLIGIWGGPQRRQAAVKFFLFTLAGSVLTFLGLLASCSGTITTRAADPRLRELTFSIPELTEAAADSSDGPGRADLDLSGPVRRLRHQGAALPAAYLAAAGPRRGADGGQRAPGRRAAEGGHLRVRPVQPAPCCPQATAALMPWLLWLSLAGIVYGALVALAQSDIKRLVAYSSVSHLGFCMLGLFAVNRLSVQGSVLQMVNHGLSTGGLFAVVGMLYERFHTRQIADFGGLARRLPVLSFFTLVLVLSSIALPGLNGFAGEFLLLAGLFQRGWAEPAPAHWLQLRTIAVLSMSGVILGAWYMLWMYQRVFFGKGGRGNQ